MNMTTSPSARPAARRSRGGFTLVEILVVVGIIVILIGVLVPLVGRAMRQAKATRTAADMASIGTALEAFKADHGDYPRVGLPNLGFALLGQNLFGPLGDGAAAGTNDANDPPAYTAGKTYGPGDVVQMDDTGGNVHYLCIAPNTTVAPPTAANWIECDPDPTKTPAEPPIDLTDSVDGPGLRLRTGGKKWGPYLAEGKFKLRGVALVDGNDNPILYFPTRPGNANVNLPGAYVSVVVNPPNLTSNDDFAKYDAFDNWSQFIHFGDANVQEPQWRIHAMLGDYNTNGQIDVNTPEAAITERPYLLWSAGPDGFFGPKAIKQGNGGTGPGTDFEANQKAVAACDDVTNFKQ